MKNPNGYSLEDIESMQDEQRDQCKHIFDFGKCRFCGLHENTMKTSTDKATTIAAGLINPKFARSIAANITTIAEAQTVIALADSGGGNFLNREEGRANAVRKIEKAERNIAEFLCSPNPEHAALVAVAEAAKVMISGFDDAERKANYQLIEMDKALANLAAVRGGGK